MKQIIRTMLLSDIEPLDIGFVAQGWPSRLVTLQEYFKEQNDGKRIVFVAELAQIGAVGYVTLLPQTTVGPYRDMKYPELVDFNVLKAYQGQGIGSKLLDAIELFSKEKYGNNITLAVGLHAGYGHAQRLYVKHGYNFDGSGAWYQGKPITPYTVSCNDDDLVLYMHKRIDYS